MTREYESADNMHSLTERTYERIESQLDDQIDYWKDQQAAVALGQFLEGEGNNSGELERIKGEIFMGESLKAMLEASLGDTINMENAMSLVGGYLQNHQY